MLILTLDLYQITHYSKPLYIYSLLVARHCLLLIVTTLSTVYIRLLNLPINEGTLFTFRFNAKIFSPLMRVCRHKQIHTYLRIYLNFTILILFSTRRHSSTWKTKCLRRRLPKFVISSSPVFVVNEKFCSPENLTSPQTQIEISTIYSSGEKTGAKLTDLIRNWNVKISVMPR